MVIIKLEYFLDSSIFLKLFLGEDEADKAIEILVNVEKGIDIGYVTPHILEEIAYKLIISKGIKLLGKVSIWDTKERLKVDKEFRKEIVRVVKVFTVYIQKLLKGGLRITAIIEDDYFKSIKFVEKYGLLSSDALIVAVMKRKNINTIATFDKDFTLVEKIKVIP